MSLIDFGACREYRKDFVDDYFRLVWSAANRDDAEIMRVSSLSLKVPLAKVYNGLVMGLGIRDKNRASRFLLEALGRENVRF